MSKLIKFAILLVVLGGLAFGGFYWINRSRPPTGPEPDQNLQLLPDTFFTKLSLDRNRFLTESLRKSGYITKAQRCDKVMVSDNKDGLLIGGKPTLEVQLSPDKNWLATVDKSNTLTLWNTKNGVESKKPIKNIPPSQLVTFSQDGKTLAAINRKGTLGLWNTATSEELKTITEPGSRFTALAFSPDGKTLATGTQYGRVKLWNVADGAPVARIVISTLPIVGLGFHPSNSPLLFASDASDVVSAILWESNFSSAALTNPPFPVAEIRKPSQVPTVAGQPVTLNVIVDNSKGKGDLYQLIGITDCPDEPLFSRKLAIFGQIPAGKSVEKTLSFETSYLWPSKSLPIHVVFTESNGFSPEPVDTVVDISGLPRPDWKIDLKIHDGKGGIGLGNGDGNIQVLESPQIEFTITNSGQSDSGKTAIEATLIDPDDGVQIFGAQKVEQKMVVVNSTVSLSFGLALKSTYQKDQLQFKVAIKEDRFGTEISKNFNLPVGKAIKN